MRCICSIKAFWEVKFGHAGKTICRCPQKKSHEILLKIRSDLKPVRSGTVDKQTRICHIFSQNDTKNLFHTFKYDVVEDYGDTCNGHPLHTWDDGKRMLVRCKTCGAYVLIQRSEYHSFTDAPDGYYLAYFSVSGPADARELNRKYDGFQLETQFKEPHIAINL